MNSGGWTSPEGTEVAATGDYREHAAYALRPLSLGEILDRSFAVYRANFWLFVGIGSISAVVQLVSNGILLVVYRGFIPTPRTGQFGFHLSLGGRQAGSGIGALLVFLVASVTQAAAVWALSQVYLGRRATIGESVRAVIGRWLRFVGIAIWQIWSFAWLPLLLIVPAALLMGYSAGRFGVTGSVVAGILMFLGIAGGGAYGVIAFIRNSLAVQSAVLEQLKVRAAMRRSKVLTSGAKARILVVYLITWCLFLVAGILEMPLSLLVVYGAMRGEKHIAAQIVMLLVNFVAYSAVVPVMLIGLTLVYFDQRVRQDGLDLLLMLGAGENTAASNSVSPTFETGEPASDAAGI